MAVEITMRTRLEEAILVILETEGRPVGRTRLVKLLFLADLAARQQDRDAFTDGQYTYDRHGPFARAILNAAEGLAEQGAATRTYWQDRDLFGLAPDAGERPAAALDAADDEILRAVVEEARGFSLRELKSVVYQHPIMAGRRRGELIDLRSEWSRATALRAALDRSHHLFGDVLQELAG